MRVQVTNVVRAVMAALLWVVPAQAQQPGPALPPAQSPPSTTVPVVPAATGPASAEDANVREVLERNCAGCHQAGKLAASALSPAKAFGNVLALDELAATAALVQPGNPDGSRLYTMIQSRHWLADEPAARKTGPTQQDLAAVRAWIDRLPQTAGCGARRPITADTVRANLTQALASRPAERHGQLRFVSLVQLYNACVSEADLAGYRQAVSRLLNGLSWALVPARLEAVDDTGTLLVLDLGSLAWTPERWEQIAAVYPYADRGPETPWAAIATEVGSAVPVVRGDWLAWAAGRPPLYYDLLGLPARIDDLLTSLKIETESNVTGSIVRRAAIRTSNVARGTRLIARHPFAKGGFWSSFEFAPAPGRQTVFDLATPSATPASNRAGLTHDGALALFSLPNGFNAFLIADKEGRRLNDISRAVIVDDAFPRRRISAGVACLSCHSGGVAAVTDQLRAEVLQSTSANKDVRERILALHPEPPELSKLIETDNLRLTGALETAGLDPAFRIAGSDPVLALAALYERPISAARASAELGLDAAALSALTEKAAGSDRLVLLRLDLGLVPRAEFEGRFPALLALASPVAKPNPIVAGPLTIGLAAVPRGEADDIDIAIIPDRIVLKPGDLLTVRARTNRACHLTLLNINAQGRATVIFPNDFDQNDFVDPGREVVVPAPGAPYQFRVRERGRESIVGTCTTDKRASSLYGHDFERQRFTELGDWPAFIARAFETEFDDKKPERAAVTPTGARAQRRGARGGRARGDTDAAAAGAIVPPRAEGRNAVQIEIR